VDRGELGAQPGAGAGPAGPGGRSGLARSGRARRGAAVLTVRPCSRHGSAGRSLVVDMDETARMHRTNRTAAAIARYAQDRVHAVEVLVDEFGWDRTFLALAACDADEAGPALWAALELLTFP